MFGRKADVVGHNEDMVGRKVGVVRRQIDGEAREYIEKGHDEEKWGIFTFETSCPPPGGSDLSYAAVRYCRQVLQNYFGNSTHMVMQHKPKNASLLCCVTHWLHSW